MTGMVENKSKRRFAVLDCGTNTFNLVVAEEDGKGFRTLYQGKIPVKLGKNGLNARELAPDAIQRAEKAFTEYKTKIDELQPEEIYISGTSAVRSARNGYVVQQACLDILGQPMHIISGADEAELIFRGVLMSGVLNDLNDALIVDIGGGSCEFIIYAHKAPVYKDSFEVGVSRLTDAFQTQDLPQPQQLSKMKGYLEEQLLPLLDLLAEYRPGVLVGSSGTFDTFEDMLKAIGRLTVKEKNWSAYSPESCLELCEDLLTSSLEERLRMPGITLFRAEMLPAAAQLVLLLMEKNSFRQVRTCHFAIKEGILFSLMHHKRLP